MKAGCQNKLLYIYNLLFEHFGPRKWWPAESSFEVVIGAILTQFVSWKNVAMAINNLKKESLLENEAICAVEETRLEELIRCTRFYKQKAKKLKSFCYYLKNNYDSNLNVFFDKDIALLRKELLSFFGIGRETADSIILYGAQKPVFVVDAYTSRIFTRLGLLKGDEDYGDIQKFLMTNLPEDVQLFNEYHALIVALGNNLCSNKKPKCSQCPVVSICGSCI